MVFLVRYLHPADHNPRRIRKVDKLYGNKLDFKDRKFPAKARDIQKLKEKFISALKPLLHIKKKSLTIM